MNVLGVGIVFNRGRGVGCLEDALREGWVNPADSVYAVKPEILRDRVLLKDARRSDRFGKMAVLAAGDALADGAPETGKDTGIIVATGFGPHATTFRFLDDILDYGDRQVSPTAFSHSVHNAAASYIASVLKTHGPTVTLTRLAFSFQQALMLADCWLREKRCTHVLVGVVDDLGKTMAYIFNRKLKVARDGRIKPFRFSPDSEAVAGEGAVFFLVTNGGDTGRRYCCIEHVRFNSGVSDQGKPDIYILDADGMIQDETAYRDVCVPPGPLITGYSPVFGSMMTGSAFNCAAAALMLRNQECYAGPVRTNPCQVKICDRTEKKRIDSIVCVRYGCRKKRAMVKLQP